MSTFRVTNASELIATLKQAQAGDTVLLKAGNYGSINLSKLNFAGNVTIKSEDPANVAHIDKLVLDKVHNLSVEQVEFGRALTATETHSTSFVSVFNSSGISFNRVHVHGSLDGNPQNDGYGMDIRNSSAIDIRNSEFEQLGRGIKFLTSTDINLVNNHVHDIRTDGMNFFQVNNVVLDRNYLHDFYPAAGDHADAIQFMSKGATRASTDIRITNNVILQGDGVPAQGIFIKDETAVLPYENVHIGNNLVYMNTYNGITVARGTNVEIIGNTSLSANTDNIKTRIWIDYVDGARVEGNVTDIFLNLQSSNVTGLNNIQLQGKPSTSILIPDVNAGSATTVEDLVIPGTGYQPTALPAALVSAPVEPVRVHDGFGNLVPAGSVQRAAAEVESPMEDLLTSGATFRNLDWVFESGPTHPTASAGKGIDAVSYMLGHADVANAGLGASGALKHWMEQGAPLGRAADGGFGDDAQKRGLSVGETLKEALDVPADKDWFSIELDAGDTVRLELGSRELDLALSVHDSSGNRVAFADGEGAGGVETIDLSSAAGGHLYVVVSSPDDLAAGAYSLSLSPVIGG